MTTDTTAISLRVKVPVLSLHIVETEPIVSIAGKRRTMAARLAMICTPIASVTVRIAGSPSGIAATKRPTTIMNASSKGIDRTWTVKISIMLATVRTRIVRTRASLSISRNNGVDICSTRSINPLMRPISVLAPVATMTPRALPSATIVPE